MEKYPDLFFFLSYPGGVRRRGLGVGGPGDVVCKKEKLELRTYLGSYVHMHLFIMYVIPGSLYTTCPPSIPGPPGWASLGLGHLNSRS